jgi:hypothetical protein
MVGIFACNLLSGEEKQISALQTFIEGGLEKVQVEAKIRELAKESSSLYLDLVVKNPARGGMVFTTSPSLDLCIQFYHWAFGFSRFIYAKSNLGSVLYKWSGSKQSGEWIVLSGKNPIYSEDQEVMVSEISTDGYGPTFRFISRGTDNLDNTRRKAIALARYFTNESTTIELRTDYFWWPGDCGHAGPQSSEFLRPEATKQILDTTDQCVLDKDSSTCIWQAVPNRRPHFPERRSK